MEVVQRIGALRDRLGPYRREGETIGLVPTMGYLHDGHLELVERACRDCDRVVVSIFVNPTQFGPNEDLALYPRDLEGDLERLARYPVDAVFAPSVEEVYPSGVQTSVSVAPLGDILMGALRPGHFTGVATVVSKLFNIVQPTKAYFGEKDYQQLAIIRRMAVDLMVPVEVVGVPTVREADGLAMSSRNVRLTAEDRAAATVLSRALDVGQRTIERGEEKPEAAVQAMRAVLDAEPRCALKSLDIRNAVTLDPVERLGSEPVVILVAAGFGSVLLIDQRVAAPHAARMDVAA